jgi:hypothetical protein
MAMTSQIKMRMKSQPTGDKKGGAKLTAGASVGGQKGGCC